MNKFKEGDWVRAIDTNEVWEVESKNFGYCPLNHILHEGMTLATKDTLI